MKYHEFIKLAAELPADTFKKIIDKFSYAQENKLRYCHHCGDIIPDGAAYYQSVDGSETICQLCEDFVYNETNGMYCSYDDKKAWNTEEDYKYITWYRKKSNPIKKTKYIDRVIKG